ncbi:MAG: hypothetical protein EBX56_08285, partial [Betaproteobacteria bacterium]|nr:hypothetical protein [Betaproteobacteria bacterium]
MFSRFPSFLFLSILTLLVAFQHVNSRANPADAASALALAACAIEAQPIALKLGEVRAVALSATQERTRWNSRPD